MTYLDFFTELVSEITGTPQEDVKRNMIEYLNSIGKSGLLHKQIPGDRVNRLREAAKTDPSLLRSFIAKGWMGIIKGMTTY